MKLTRNHLNNTLILCILLPYDNTIYAHFAAEFVQDTLAAIQHITYMAIFSNVSMHIYVTNKQIYTNEFHI